MHYTLSRYKKIMVVDDNSIDRLITERFIANTSFSEEVIECKSAKQALHYLEENKNCNDRLPEIIFLDINMPEMSGFDFLNAFVGLNQRKEISIIMLSSSIDPVDIVKAKGNRNVRGYISKPVTLEKIHSVISK